MDIKPQPRQEQFLATPADVAVFGGSAFGGKTWALLMEPLRHIENKDFGAVIFRRTVKEITNEGALWDEAAKIYPLLDGKPNENEKQYKFSKGSRITFSHMQHEKDKYTWKSSQVPLLIFDQLEMFTSSQFFYMLSRNRSACGVRPYVRASANPEPGWLADFLDWWIDEDGWAIPERSGVVRWMVRESDKTYWSDDRESLQAEHPKSTPKSVTFILSTIYDNKIGMEQDPDYIANLQALDYVERQRLLGDGVRGGNWKVKPAAGKVFNRAWFEIVDAVPAGGKVIRFWDFAATEQEISTAKTKNDPDYTSSTKATLVNGITYVLDMTNEQMSPARTNTAMRNIAEQDGRKVVVRFEQEGGASGKRDAYNVVTSMQGFDVRGVPSTKDKVKRAQPLAAQALAGNVKLLRGPWNEEWLAQMHGFPDLDHDDVPDSSSGCYNALTGPQTAGAFGRRK
jgi:predicted phage terminase large subunit-like protein